MIVLLQQSLSYSLQPVTGIQEVGVSFWMTLADNQIIVPKGDSTSSAEAINWLPLHNSNAPQPQDTVPSHTHLCLKMVSCLYLCTGIFSFPLVSFTESQNGRGWKGPLWVTQPNPHAETGSPTAGCRGPCPGRS